MDHRRQRRAAADLLLLHVVRRSTSDRSATSAATAGRARRRSGRSSRSCSASCSRPRDRREARGRRAARAARQRRLGRRAPRRWRDRVRLRRSSSVDRPLRRRPQARPVARPALRSSAWLVGGYLMAKERGELPQQLGGAKGRAPHRRRGLTAAALTVDEPSLVARALASERTHRGDAHERATIEPARRPRPVASAGGVAATAPPGLRPRAGRGRGRVRRHRRRRVRRRGRRATTPRRPASVFSAVLGARRARRRAARARARSARRASPRSCSRVPLVWVFALLRRRRRRPRRDPRGLPPHPASLRSCSTSSPGPRAAPSSSPAC